MTDLVSRRSFLCGAAALATSLGTTGCTGGEKPTMETPASSDVEIDFPDPTEGTVALGAVLRGRRSVREFSPRDLTDAEIGQLLWAAQGVTADWGGRTAPSAGATYPLEVHAITRERTLRYRPDGHRGVGIIDGDLRPDLQAASLDQSALGSAPVVFAISVVPARTADRYGSRAARYIDLEVGHAAQNLLLQAVALDLGAVPIGAFDDDRVAALLTLPEGHEPRYLVPVGMPR